MITDKKESIMPIKNDELFYLLLKKDMNILEFLVMHIMNYSYQRVHGKVEIENTKGKDEDNNLILKIENTTIIIYLNTNYDGNYMRNFLFACQREIDNYNAENIFTRDFYSVPKVVLLNLDWYKNLEDSKKMKIKEVSKVSYASFIDDFMFQVININLNKFSKVSYNELKNEDCFYKLLTIANKEELTEFMKKYNENNLLDNYQTNLIEISKKIK